MSHYSCKICGQRYDDCVCKPVLPLAVKKSKKAIKEDKLAQSFKKIEALYDEIRQMAYQQGITLK